MQRVTFFYKNNNERHDGLIETKGVRGAVSIIQGIDAPNLGLTRFPNFPLLTIYHCLQFNTPGPYLITVHQTIQLFCFHANCEPNYAVC
jgi:hypothetical protein